MYEAAIITTDSSSVNRPITTTKRTSLINSNRGDFMSNLTPQWPEPEETATVEQQESFPFIRYVLCLCALHSATGCLI